MSDPNKKNKLNQLLVLLKFMVKHGGTDLHISTGSLAMIRIGGSLQRLDTQKFSDDLVKALVFPIMNDAQILRLEREKGVEFSFIDEKIGTFRVSVFKQRKGHGLVVRSLFREEVDLDELGVPEELKRVCLERKGLILVSGLARSGKTTTLSGIINFMNRHRKSHIITLEDPVEYIHESKKCMINQRGRGEDFISYEKALQESLREDPDVIVLSRIESFGVAREALKAAERGHLVIATITAVDGVESIIKVAQMFPDEKQSEVRFLLATELRAVLSQNLNYNKDKGEFEADFGFLKVTEKVKKMLWDGMYLDIRSYIEQASPLGMSVLNRGSSRGNGEVGTGDNVEKADLKKLGYKYSENKSQQEYTEVRAFQQVDQGDEEKTTVTKSQMGTFSRSTDFTIGSSDLSDESVDQKGESSEDSEFDQISDAPPISKLPGAPEKIDEFEDSVSIPEISRLDSVVDSKSTGVGDEFTIPEYPSSEVTSIASGDETRIFEDADVVESSKTGELPSVPEDSEKEKKKKAS